MLEVCQNEYPTSQGYGVLRVMQDSGINGERHNKNSRPPTYGRLWGEDPHNSPYTIHELYLIVEGFGFRSGSLL